MSPSDWLAVGLTLGVCGALMLFGLFVSYLWRLSGAAATANDRDEGPAAPPSPYDWQEMGL